MAAQRKNLAAELSEGAYGEHRLQSRELAPCVKSGLVSGAETSKRSDVRQMAVVRLHQVVHLPSGGLPITRAWKELDVRNQLLRPGELCQKERLVIRYLRHLRAVSERQRRR